MAVNIPKLFGIIARVGLAIVTGVQQIDAIVRVGGTLTDAQKRAAVLELVGIELAMIEGIAGKDLANDPDVLAAAGGVIDAFVSFQKIFRRKVMALHRLAPEHDTI